MFKIARLPKSTSGIAELVFHIPPRLGVPIFTG